MSSENEFVPVTLSFEFFPPKQATQERRFWRTVGCLETLKPKFFSMTYGALGTDRTVGYDMLRQLTKESPVPVAAHLTCGGRRREDLDVEIERFRALGINRFVALRGDKTDNDVAASGAGTFRFAEDLVQLLNEQPGTDISVAAYPEVHPEASSEDADLNALKRKLELGGARAITQFFYEPDAFLRLRDRAQAAGIEKPIVPGILPIHDIEKVMSFSKRCGTRVPLNLIDEFRVWSHDHHASRELAIAHGTSLCEILKREGVEHFHFYTLNQSDLSYEVAKRLVKVSEASAAAA